MKVVVLGASGGVGRELVTQAKKRGHDVTAVGRASSSIEVPDGVSVVRCDLSDEAGLTGAFAGADVVLSGVGLRLPGLSPFAKAEVPDLLTTTTPVVVAAMKAAGVGKVVAVSAGGVGDSRALMPGFFKVFIALTSMRGAYKELEVMEQVYRDSGLDVCCVRPTGLSDDEATGKAVSTRKLDGRAEIPRADVAAWMLDEAEAASFSEFGPLITVTGAA
ncbi:MAG: NAD(P)H-binding protein [Deltaproteobacteria bacterium]|nr:NAD(P)H-binding protein [Deltaproteobacteria bacterium]